MEIDLSNLPMGTRQRMDEIFRGDFNRELMAAVERQTAIAAANHLNRPRSKDDFGPKILEVDSYIDAFWRRAYGPDYLSDKDLVKFLERRNPEITVRSQGTRIQSGYSPGVNSRWRKRYGEGEKGERPTSNVQRPTSNERQTQS